MSKEEENREDLAAGNAEGLQKLEIDGFSEEAQVWSWKAFKNKAKFLAMKNHFNEEQWTAMEAEALIEILSDDAIVYEPASDKTVEEYLRGVISRKLKHAAAKVADERSIWTESRRSLDTAGGADDESSTLGDLVMDGADLNVNRKLIEQPRAVRTRNTIKRLRNSKDRSALERFRAALRGETVMADDSNASPQDVEVDSMDNPFAAPLPDDFADDAETLNRTVIDVKDYHAKAVAEVGFAPNEDDEVPQRTFRMRSTGFGVPSSASRRQGLKGDVKELMGSLPFKYKAWCRHVKDGVDPVAAYKTLKINKNEYYKKVLPRLRQVFAELAGSY